MLLQHATWPEVETRLTRPTALVVPLGSTEQHGPTGYLGTDWLCPQIIAERAHETSDILVGPPLTLGMAQHHLAFPGTLALRPSTLIAVIRDLAASLAATRFRRLYVLNGHGGNVASLQAAFSEIHAEASFRGAAAPLGLTLRNWWELSGVPALISDLYPRGHGSHATPSEIAVTWAARPPGAPFPPPEPRVAPSGPIREAVDFRRRHPDGRMGSDPSLATPEAGRRIIELAARSLAEEVRRLEAEDAAAAASG